ncbi:MAG: sigma 54-interacting transcriptional regulator, partial [Terriglobia bacterium]
MRRTMGYRLLIVEDAQPAPEAHLERSLPTEGGFHCEHILWDVTNAHKLQSSLVDLDLIVVALSTRASTISLLDWLRNYPLSPPTLAVLSDSSDEEVLRAASQTADDFIFHPLRPGEFRQRVERMIGARRREWQPVAERLTKELGLAQLVGQDPLFAGMVEKLSLIAASDAPVLLLGETGTGKELCARAIHHLGKRARSHFIPVECGAIPDFLAENELFGHARGAYTDARNDQKGVAALADGGTLFLDEIDSLSLAAQAKLLRFLQDGTYRALGAERFVQANVRVIAATNRDLEVAVRESRFRSDLYFRVNVLQLHLPPLRARRGDITLLAQHFLNSLSSQKSSVRKSFSPGALRMLEHHDWPGNVRELRNVVERAVVFSSGAQILPCHIAVSGPPPAPAPAAMSFHLARRQSIEQFERHYVEQMLRTHRGNITRAAFAAGKDRRVFG